MPSLYDEALAALGRARSDLGQAAALVERARRGAGIPPPVEGVDLQHQILHRVLGLNGPLAPSQIWFGISDEGRALFGGSAEAMREFLEANPDRYARRAEYWGLSTWIEIIWEQVGQHSTAVRLHPRPAARRAPRVSRPPNIVAKTVATAERLIAELGRPVTTAEVAAALRAEHGYESRPANVSAYLSSSRRRFRSGPNGWALRNAEAEKEDKT